LTGLFWSLIGTRELFRFDEGIPRFQGALTPAPFSMLCLGAVAASLLWLRVYATFDWFLVVNFFFCLISGTRNTTACYVFVLVIYLVTERTKGVKVRKGALFIISILTLVVFSGVARARLSDIDLLNDSKTSGRTNAWQFYASFFWDDKWFGHGLGFSSSINELRGISRISRAFVSPHNSYLQLLLDIGVIGISILLVVLILTLMSNARRQNSIIFTQYKGTLRPLVLAVPFFFAFDNYINTPQFNILVMVVYSLMIKGPTQGYRPSAKL
jgi:O-antigen ligase